MTRRRWIILGIVLYLILDATVAATFFAAALRWELRKLGFEIRW